MPQHGVIRRRSSHRPSADSSAFVAWLDRFRLDAERVFDGQEEAWSNVLLWVWRTGIRRADFADDEHVRNWLFGVLKRAVWAMRVSARQLSQKRAEVGLGAVLSRRRCRRRRVNEDVEPSPFCDLAKEVLEQMPDHRRSLLMLLHVAERPLREVGEVLAMRGSTVCWHRQRAEAEFRGRFEGTWKGERASSFDAHCRRRAG